MSDSSNSNDGARLLLEEVGRRAQEVIAMAAPDRQPVQDPSMQSVLKHIEAIVERAVHSQVDPLQRLVTEAEELISLQFEHLARIKAEVQTLVVNGERAGVVAAAVSGELKNMRDRHADLLSVATRPGEGARHE